MAQFSNSKLLDRPEPGLIKWSPTNGIDSFVHVNLQHRVVQLYKPTGHARRGKFDYERVAKLDDIPPLSTYDWSPAYPGFIAIGTASGTVNLLNLNDASNHYLEQRLKFTRFCQAIAFNTGTLLAVGLERVRNDQCLQIWDINRLAKIDPRDSWSSLNGSILGEPVHRLEPATTVSSAKFFEDNPQTLVVGIKNQSIRIYDLRDPHGGVITFQTKCNNNVAIDYADTNYFASSSLDRPGVVVWDRRATQRSTASSTYLHATEADGIPWGAALNLDRAIDINPSNAPERGSLIRSIRFCKNQRGLLAVLSRTGQLCAIDTKKEFPAPEREYDASPELLEARRSHELDMSFTRDDRKLDQIVSFDWVTLPSPILRPRALVLRASGAYEILEKPSYTAEHIYKMIPWQAPYRGLEEGSSYHSLMQFDTTQYSEMMGSLLVDEAVKDVPLFGEEKLPIIELVSAAINSLPQPDVDTIISSEEEEVLPESFEDVTSTADKLQILRRIFRKTVHSYDASVGDGREVTNGTNLENRKGTMMSNRQSHESLLSTMLDMRRCPKPGQIVIDHILLLRSKERYLFDYAMNVDIVSDDPWLQDIWHWISGASAAAYDDGMVSQGIDFSYMGVVPLWKNDLGRNEAARLVDGATHPDSAAWERSLQNLNAGSGEPPYEMKTDKAAHRQAALRVCGWGKIAQSTVSANYAKLSLSEKNSSAFTRSAARELFEGNRAEAVKILKTASAEYPELLFVSLAVQLIDRGDVNLAKEQLDFDDAAASKTDPYLRAISSLVATGNWEAIANQESLSLSERTYVAVRYLDDDKLTRWLDKEQTKAIENGDVEGIVLTGITDKLVDIFAKYIEKFSDVQTATLVLSICAPRYIDDYRCIAWRNAYRAYLQRHKAFIQRTKFEVESTKKSKKHGRPLITPPSRQIALRCVYCDAEYELSKMGSGMSQPQQQPANSLMATSIHAGVSCPNCGRHLPRCIVCLEVVGIPRSDRPELSHDPQIRVAAKFPTFCLKCDHVLHLDHARQWFARHVECPVPECRCRCNFRANPELNYR